jgi:hypothetical protein
LVWAVCVLIPGIGPFISVVPTVFLGFANGPTTGVLATIFAIVWSQLENNVIVPRVMNHTVKLNPLVVLSAVLIGHELLGLAGALFAIPIAAALAVVVDEVHEQRLSDERRMLDAQQLELDFGFDSDADSGSGPGSGSGSDSGSGSGSNSGSSFKTNANASANAPSAYAPSANAAAAARP